MASMNNPLRLELLLALASGLHCSKSEFLDEKPLRKTYSNSIFSIYIYTQILE